MKKILILYLFISFFLFNIFTFSTSAINDPNNELIIDLNEEYTYDVLTIDMQELESKYADLIKHESIGKSHDNRDIWLIKLGLGDIKILLEGGNHGREYASTPILMKMIEDYSNAYQANSNFKGYDVKSILDKVTFYFVPMLNPDGVELARRGIDSINDEVIKSELIKINNSFEFWKSNARGVDLNRNFPCKTWGNFENGIHYTYNPKPSLGYFGGYHSNSELETQSLVDLLHRNNFISCLSYHSRGNIIYWWKPFESKEYNRLQNEIVQILSKETGYRPVPRASEHNKDGTDGTISDHISDYYHKPVFTIESLSNYTTFPVKVDLVKDAYNELNSSALALAIESIHLHELDYYEYKVYQFDNFLHDFHNYENALEYAKRWDHSSILRKGEEVYRN